MVILAAQRNVPTNLLGMSELEKFRRRREILERPQNLEKLARLSRFERDEIARGVPLEKRLINWEGVD